MSAWRSNSKNVFSNQTNAWPCQSTATWFWINLIAVLIRSQENVLGLTTDANPLNAKASHILPTTLSISVMLLDWIVFINSSKDAPSLAVSIWSRTNVQQNYHAKQFIALQKLKQIFPSRIVITLSANHGIRIWQFRWVEDASANTLLVWVTRLINAT